MDMPERGFLITEFAQRLGRAQRGMARAGLDALLLTTEPEVRWFTGFLTEFWQSPTRPWFLVVPRDGEPIAVIPGIGEPLMARTWIDDIRTWPSPRPGDEGVSSLAGALRDAGAAPRSPRCAAPRRSGRAGSRRSRGIHQRACPDTAAGSRGR